jgi:hypothetical protein
MSRLESDQERRLRRRRERRERLSSGTITLLVILGTALNLLGLILLIGNIATVSRLWLSGQPIALGGEHLAPFGAFLAGVLCFAIAFNLD